MGPWSYLERGTRPAVNTFHRNFGRKQQVFGLAKMVLHLGQQAVNSPTHNGLWRIRS